MLILNSCINITMEGSLYLSEEVADVLLRQAWTPLYELKQVQSLPMLLHHHLKEVLILICLQKLRRRRGHGIVRTCW